MVFQWDPAKNAANAKHAVSFQDAIRIFEGPVLEMRDFRRDYGEEPIIAIGMPEDLALTSGLRHPRRVPPNNLSKEGASS